MEADKLKGILNELLAPNLLVFNICFVYIGMLLSQSVTLSITILVTIAFLSGRSAGIIANRYVGRDIDLSNPKKSGMYSLGIPKQNLLVMFAILFLVFAASAYALNRLSFMLTPLVLLLFFVDPKSKKYTNKRHYLVGIIESFDVLGGYIGAAGAIPTSVVVYLFAFSIIFIGGGFDILYSITHTQFDIKYKLKTVPSTIGINAALDLSLYSHIMAIAFLLAAAVLSGSYIIIAGAIGASALLLAQHHGINPHNDTDIRRRIALYNSTAALVMLSSFLVSTLV